MTGIIDDASIEAAGGDPVEAIRRARDEALEEYAKTQKKPERWHYDVGLFTNTMTFREVKFKSVQEILDKARPYFESQVERGKPATMAGLRNALEFNTPGHYCNYAKRHPEFRPVLNFLHQLLMIPLEEALVEVGTNTSGIKFALTNIPMFWEPDEDANLSPPDYPWKEKRTVEQVGAGGGALEVDVSDRTVSEIWREMQKAGRRLKDDTEEEVPN